MSTVNAPNARNNHTVVWTGTEAIVWGANVPTISGGRYCAQTSAPTPTPTPTATPADTPSPTVSPSATPARLHCNDRRSTPTATPRPTPTARPGLRRGPGQHRLLDPKCNWSGTVAPEKAIWIDYELPWVTLDESLPMFQKSPKSN